MFSVCTTNVPSVDIQCYEQFILPTINIFYMVVFRFIDKNWGYSEYFSKKTLDNNKSSLHYKMVKEITFSFSTFHENV